MRFLQGSTYLLDTTCSNLWGNYYRLTGLTGGYYNPLNTTYYDVANVATTYALAFPNDVAMDHIHSCLIQTKPANGASMKTWSAWCAYGLTLNIGGYVGWYTMSMIEAPTYADWGLVTPLLPFRNNLPLDWENGLKVLGDTYRGSGTIQCMVIQPYGHITSTTKLNTNKTVLIHPMDFNNDIL